MTTSLNITHHVSDSIRDGVDDPSFGAVDLEYDSADRARAFLASLQTEIWPNSPHFRGTPTTYLLEAAEVSS